ncbi:MULTISPECIES: Dabb family protein [Actinomadura]|uniref:Dabb family protein n=1 Tax=Actinomadura yumaensis TaxID=111807 RepID=A0ABW2CDU1_9ACTN|nr:Dabb family protein [Actinomadura sp. J1-007]MWK38335.1 Dabb family protein [Actinomadura sp. J1-007]
MLTHLVLMKFTDAADAPRAKELLESLDGRVAEIRELRVLDVVGSEPSFDLCLITGHASVAELAGYQRHPAHLEVASWLRPRLADRAVVDYES